MTRTKRRTKNQRGFALFLIVLIVALVAVTGGTLLDMVNVDLVISGEHRKTATANAAAIGGVLEAIGDETLTPLNLPDPQNPVFNYAQIVGGVPVRPAAPPATYNMNESNSAFTRNVGQTYEENYTADIRLVRLGPAFESGVDKATGVVYEVRSVSNVNSGSATKEVRALVYRIIAGDGANLENASGLHQR